MVDQAGSLFDPEGFGAGGFLDDVDCRITDAAVVTGIDTPMKDTDAVERTFVKVTFDPDEDTMDARDEYYSLGPIDKFTPSKDNKRVVYEAGTKINKNSKAALFFAGLINAGFPKSQLPNDGDVTFLIGLHVHVNNMPMAEMKGGKTGSKFVKKDGTAPSVVLVTRLLEDTVPAKSAGATKAAPAAAAKKTGAAPAKATEAAPAGNDDAETAVIEAILTIIAEKGMATKRLLPTEMMQRITDAKLRTAAFKLVGDSNWLGGADRPWTFDAGSGELKLPE